jgi:carbon-monoxide dehydrogenase medium subunit
VGHVIENQAKEGLSVKEIEFEAPQTLTEAVALLRERGKDARVLAGGTDLIVQLREGKREPDLVVDVKGIPELYNLSYSATSGLLLGAAVPCSKVYNDPVVCECYPGLIDAASLIGSIQIQSRASLGGNLCNGSPAADGVPPLIVLSAVCRIAGPNGERELPAEEFITGPGQTVLGPQEILVSLRLPPPPERSGAKYLRFIPRNEMDIAVAGAASYLELDQDGKTIRAARVVLAAVAPTPLLVGEAADVLIGKPASEDLFEAAAEAARKAARPITDMRGAEWQRRHLAGVLVRRTLQGALERARGTE